VGLSTGIAAQITLSIEEQPVSSKEVTGICCSRFAPTPLCAGWEGETSHRSPPKSYHCPHENGRVIDKIQEARYYPEKSLGVDMITAIATFQLPNPITIDEARKIFLSTAPKYQNVTGLIRKYYLLSPDGSTVSGVYLWNSREEADGMYTESWRSLVRGKYGTDPLVTYMDCLVVVDNLSQEIIEA